MSRTAHGSGEPLPSQCGQPPAKTPATAACPTIQSVAATGDAGNRSSGPKADTATEPTRRETDTCTVEQRPTNTSADGNEMSAPEEPEPAADLKEWKTTQTSYYRQRRRDAEGRLSEWMPKLCAGAFGTTLYLGANLAGPPEWTELLGAAWTCWIVGLLTWYASGLTDIRANDTAVNNISCFTAADHNGAATEDDVFGAWNRRTRWLARLTELLLLTGVLFALAFAWINIGKIGGPNAPTESRSTTDDTATATARRVARTAGTDADTAAEYPSSTDPARIATSAIVMSCNGSGKSLEAQELRPAARALLRPGLDQQPHLRLELRIRTGADTRVHQRQNQPNGRRSAGLSDLPPQG